MKLRPARLLTALCALVIALPAWAQEAVSPATVVATVNGVEITAGEIAIMRSQLPPQYQQAPNDQIFDALVDQAINQELFAAELQDMPPVIADSLAIEARALRAGFILQALTEEAVTDAALQALYDETYADAEPSREYNAAHILVASEAEALDVIKEIEGGAVFAEVAKARSTGPSGPNGGDLGWFGAGMMVPSFEAAVMALETGAISAPVETQFGWHVIQLKDSRLSEAPTLEDVRGELTEQVRDQVVEARLNALIDNGQITRSAAQEIDPSFLSNPDFYQQ